MVIPAGQFKKSLIEGAKHSGERKDGKQSGQAIWKFFQSGVQMTDDLVLPDLVDEVEGRWVFGASNGMPGSGTRVPKCFPTIAKWSGTVTYLIFDTENINRDIFERMLRRAGMFVGIGTFRPANGGDYGRYKVVKIKWHNDRTIGTEG